MTAIQPLSKTSSSSSSAVPSLNDVGQAAVKAEGAQRTLAELKGQLKSTDAKLTPAERAALTKQIDAAKREADAAVQVLKRVVDRFVGPAKARDQAAALDAALPKADQAIAAAQAAAARANAQYARDVDASTSKNPATVTKAEASGKGFEAAKQTVAELEAAKRALRGEIQPRQEKALADAKRPEVDLADFASNTRAQQVKVLGAPITGISQGEAISVDVKRVNAATTNGGIENGAKMLKRQLEESGSPEHQVALIEGASASISRMVLEGNSDVAKALLDTMKNVSPEAQKALASKLATGVFAGPAFTAELHARLEKNEGFLEAGLLTKALAAQGHGEIAANLGGIVTGKVKALRDEFATRGREVQKLNGDLARLVLGFGPMMTAEQQQAAIAKFKGNHAFEYGKFDDAAKALLPAVPYAVAGFDKQIVNALPMILETPSGQKLLTDAMARQGKGERTFLDEVAAHSAQWGNDLMKIPGALSTALTKAATLEAIALTKQGRVAEAAHAIDHIKRNAVLFGADPQGLAKVGEQMKNVLNGGGDVARAALKEELKALDAGSPGFGPRSAQALKGVALAVSAFAFADGVRNFNPKDLAQMTATFANGLGMVGDGAAFAAQVLGDTTSQLALAGKTLGAVGTAVGAVVEGLAAVNAFRDGRIGDGIASSAASLGSFILATASVATVPVAGQVAAAVMLIGGSALKVTFATLAADTSEAEMQGDAEDFLRAGGVNPMAADVMSDLVAANGRNVGPFIQQLAPMMKTKMTPAELFQKLQQLPRKKLDEVVKMAKDWPVNSDGHFRKSGGVESLEAAAYEVAELLAGRGD